MDGPGIAALLLAALSWAAGSLQAASRDDPWPGRRAATHLITGGLVLLLASLATGELGSFDPTAVSGGSLLALAYLAVFGSLVAFSAYVWLLGRLEPSTVTSHAYVNPAVAVVLGATVGGETLAPRTLVGAGLIVLAVVAVVRGGRRRVEREAGDAHGAGEARRPRPGGRKAVAAATPC